MTGIMHVGPNWNDSLDHLVTALLAVIFSAGLFVIQLHQGSVPEWGVGALGAVLGFYFRGRTNGQYNDSKMSRIETMEARLNEAAEARLTALESKIGDEGSM